MCTVLQQHLNQTNGFAGEHAAATSTPATSTLYSAAGTPTPTAQRHLSPVRLHPLPTYSYLQDTPNMKRPIEPYDRKVSTPAMHFHLPQRGRSAGAGSSSTRESASYLQQLLGRRSRSHSRSGMRRLVHDLESSTPRPRSPHMNNEEPINLSHYPDGRVPEENDEKPIERDDFPAPPFAYSELKRRRHYSEPSTRTGDSSRASTPVVSSSDEDEVDEVVDVKLDRTENELRKISTGMGQVFLQELAVEREKRKHSKSTRFIDPRSAARSPAANKLPHFRLRYDSPINASPSRVADHLRPWEDDVDGTLSRRSNVVTPFLPQTPHPPGQRVVSPIHPIRPGYTQQKVQTLPSRFSPGGYESSMDGHGGHSHTMGDKTYSTDFSSAKSDDLSDKSGGGGGHGSPVNGHAHTSPRSPRGENIRVSSTYTQGLQAATPRSRPGTTSPGGGRGHGGVHPGDLADGSDLNRSLPNMPSPLQAPNIYPLHLLFTTNYRLPGDVDRCSLEKHLSDAEFDMVFRMSREDFYKLPYWKRCDLKRKYHLF